MASPNIRDVVPEDYAEIVRINREFVHFTSEMDEQRLAEMDAASSYHRAVKIDDKLVAFILVMGPGANYGSVNYRWFDERYDDFYYIDRIVIDGTSHRKGIGALLYDDLIEYAKKVGIYRLTCEYYTTPENPVSAAFHQKYGFVEVGNQVLVPGKKVVSMQTATL